jgi:hypothetical protein
MQAAGPALPKLHHQGFPESQPQASLLKGTAYQPSRCCCSHPLCYTEVCHAGGWAGPARTPPPGGALGSHPSGGAWAQGQTHQHTAAPAAPACNIKYRARFRHLYNYFGGEVVTRTIMSPDLAKGSQTHTAVDLCYQPCQPQVTLRMADCRQAIPAACTTTSTPQTPSGSPTLLQCLLVPPAPLGSAG